MERDLVPNHLPLKSIPLKMELILCVNLILVLGNWNVESNAIGLAAKIEKVN